MFWIIYCLILILINLVASIICFFIYWCNRNTEYDELDHRKIKKEKGSIIEKVDAFYSNGEKVESLIKSGSILYRKAKLSNIVNEKGARREVWFLIGSAVLGALASSLGETAKIKEVLKGIGIVIPNDGEGLIYLIALIFTIVAIMLFNTVNKSMEDASSEAYRYELSQIEKILNNRVNSSQSSGKVLLLKDKNDRTSIVTLR